MKIVVAPDSFKNNLSAIQVANYIEQGIKKVDSGIEVHKIPVADGGEGTVEALVMAAGGQIIEKSVIGPLGDKIPSFFGILSDGTTAVIEMAAAAGIMLVKEDKLNPLETTTYGVGELILEAIHLGCKKIIIGIGGSSTNDGGMGMAQALGVKFFNADGDILGLGGKYMKAVCTMELPNLGEIFKDIEIIVACDVKNTLYGPKGATYIYGPQKGATNLMLEELENGMKIYANVIMKTMGTDISLIPGSGAAGGLGGGLIAFTGATLKSGIDIVIETSHFEDIIKDADLLITGEGKTDGQTVYGKVPVGLALVAKKFKVPVICLSGGLGEGYEDIYNFGIDAAFSNVTDAMSLKEAMKKSGEMLTQSAYSLVRLIKSVQKN